MRKLLLSSVLLAAIPCAQAQALLDPTAQTTALTPSGHTWSRVQSLTPGTVLHISARTQNLHCTLQSADADTLTCLAAGKPTTYQRADIKSIKVPHRGRSTLIGLVAGAGLGAIIGAAAAGGSSNFNLFSRGDVAAIFAIPFGLVGALIGALTDFTSSTVYRA